MAHTMWTTWSAQQGDSRDTVGSTAGGHGAHGNSLSFSFHEDLGRKAKPVLMAEFSLVTAAEPLLKGPAPSSMEPPASEFYKTALNVFKIKGRM